MALSCSVDVTSDEKISENAIDNKEIGQDTTISVQWLGLSCFCPNWIEIQHLKKLKNDTLGKTKDQYSIALMPSDSLNDLYNHPQFGKQKPLIFELKGRFFKNKIKHTAKGMSYTSRTFQYDTYQMIEY